MIRLLTQFDFYPSLAETPGLALVIFTGPACGACRRLKTVLEREAELFADTTLFEVDAVHEGGLTREFEVFHLPSLFLFRDGHYHAPIEAEALGPALRQAIDAAAAGPAQEAP